MFLFLSLEFANIHILFEYSGVLGENIEYFGLLRRSGSAKAVFFSRFYGVATPLKSTKSNVNF